MLLYQNLETQFTEGLGLTRRPVAVTFCDAPPQGVTPFAGTAPSGCTFWKLAAEGSVFFTVNADHYNCPIGSFTQNVQLPEERGGELQQTLGLMSDIGYVRMEEVPQIFRLTQAPGCVVYAPLADTPLAPAVVLFAGRPASLMLLVEAATRAGVASSLPLLARPTCMAIPAALASGVVSSAGCIGNRVYTGIGDDELYTAAPAASLEAVARELETIRAANATLRDYHSGRRQSLSQIH